MSAGGQSDRTHDRGHKNVPRGAALRDYLAEATHNVEQLEKVIQSLPRVDGNGGSDCPFAKELYARKEELESQVAKAVTTLNGYHVGLEKEIARCRRNLQRITRGRSRLKTSPATNGFGSAEQAQQEELSLAVSDHDAVTMGLGRAEAVLSVSQTRKHSNESSGRSPHGELSALPPRTTHPNDGRSAQKTDVTGGELGNVLAIGPLWKR